MTHQIISYTRLITKSVPCYYCGGKGFHYCKTYHNQYNLCKCYLCAGTGQRDVVTSEDATAYVLSLENTAP